MTIDPRLPAALTAGPFEEFLGDIAALGVMPVTASGISYGMIRARSNARWWLLPTAQGPATSASLSMYQPVSTNARLARLWIRTALRLGLTSAWASGRIRFSRQPRLPDGVLPKLGTCAYFTGTDGPHRKTAIQLMNREGDILGYAKVSRRAAVRPYLWHEARILDQVAKLKLTTAEIPNVLAFQDPGEGLPTILATDSCKAAGVSSPMDPAAPHLRFLGEMMRRTGSAGAHSANRSLREMAGDRRLTEQWETRFWLGLERLEQFVPAMPVGLAHGDFTPWNSFLLNGRLYVFDWEYAAEEYPSGYDLTHYLLAARGAGEPGEVADQLVARVAEAVLDGDRAFARAAVLMSLLLHAGFYLRRAMKCSGDCADWAEGQARGCIIDALLNGRG
ncbi:phosphotransferase [uncultured Hoeflea sp.]|uniref:phosphotransferase n=1 Tax=uncultured Hoeflea sp. TaxID=538666 RepID=UPI0030D7BE96